MMSWPLESFLVLPKNVLVVHRTGVGHNPQPWCCFTTGPGAF